MLSIHLGMSQENLSLGFLTRQAVYNHRRLLEAFNFRLRKKRDSTIYNVAKTMALITATAPLFLHMQNSGFLMMSLPILYKLQRRIKIVLLHEQERWVV